MKLSEVARALGLPPDAGEAKVKEALGRVDGFAKELANTKAAAEKSAQIANELALERSEHAKAKDAIKTLTVANEKLRVAVVGEALRDGKVLIADKDKAMALLANDAGEAEKVLRRETIIHVANVQVSVNAANRQGREIGSDDPVQAAHLQIVARAAKDQTSYETAYFTMQREGSLPFTKRA